MEKGGEGGERGRRKGGIERWEKMVGGEMVRSWERGGLRREDNVKLKMDDDGGFDCWE